ncbi:MAG: peptide ABC transporter ATP-binding protein [Deltaproteobacteria bacterium]|jgi:oligopeptide/dipeptide ABC transporter ATP-binding protein|nr:peptide ABC transporter ATP-binding protein [Deltaproteobacteria bacterium]
MALLEIDDLQTHFGTDAGLVRAVDGVSFDVDRGETVAVVGESGCGKSVTALSILRLVATPPGIYAGGAIRLEGENLLEASEDRMREVRGNEIAMIFQEPMTSLNPVFTVGGQIVEAIQLHQGLASGPARERAIFALDRVGIPAAAQRIDDYPHQMSGGMRQRVMIAMALACNPRLLIADEPTTALDVTIQAQILELLARLQSELEMSVLLITHDLGVVAETAQRVVVMYAGRIVEQAPVEALFGTPRHPYTVGLMKSLPRLDGPDERLVPIEGGVPDALHMPTGCRFHPRCPLAIDRCAQEEPPLVDQAGHQVACWRDGEGAS